MVRREKGFSCRLLLCLLMLTASLCMAAYADEEELSDDNSLSSLGIMTPDAEVSPDFSYDIWTYDVVVPAGTTELELDPVPSNSKATIDSISGVSLDEEGNGTVEITVVSESGLPIIYTLNVSREEENLDPVQAISENEAAFAQAAPAPEPPEPQTEDTRYVKVDRNSLQEAENTIERLQKEIEVYKDRNTLFTYVIYGLIATSVVFLFIMINLLLKKRDLAHELKEGRGRNPEADRRDIPPYGPDGGYASDNWQDDEDDWSDTPSRKKAKGSGPDKGRQMAARDDDRYYEQNNNARTSWAETHIGTPVEPTRRPVKNAGGPDRQQAGAPRDDRPPARGARQETRRLDETRRYRALDGRDEQRPAAPAPGRNSGRVPGDRTRMIKKVENLALSPDMPDDDDWITDKPEKAPEKGQMPKERLNQAPDAMPAGQNMNKAQAADASFEDDEKAGVKIDMVDL